jgi:hypothetical protein
MPTFFPLIMGFTGNYLTVTRQIVKIFQGLRKIFRHLIRINRKHPDFIGASSGPTTCL